MDKRTEFNTAFNTTTGKDLKTFFEKKNYKDFAEILNKDTSLRDLFHEALREVEDEKNDPAAGLGNLFGTP